MLKWESLKSSNLEIPSNLVNVRIQSIPPTYFHIVQLIPIFSDWLHSQDSDSQDDKEIDYDALLEQFKNKHQTKSLLDK